MSSIANLLVSLKTEFGSTDTALGSLIDKLNQTSEAASKTGEAAHGAKSGIEELGEGAEEGESFLDKFGESLSEAGGEILAFGAGALELTSIFEALKEAVEVSAELEATHVALESLTGSAEKATEVLENMEQIAHSEALKFTELIPAAQHMIALGFTVEQTASAMKAAGNAAWALGEPVGSVAQRLGMIAETGRVSNLFLRTLGLSTQELGKIMGISEGEVTKAMQALSETDRIDIMTEALRKYGDVAEKEADTVKGKWIELQNTWHEAFAVMGNDLTDIVKNLESFVTAVGHVVTYADNALTRFAETPRVKAMVALLSTVASFADKINNQPKSLSDIITEENKKPDEEEEKKKDEPDSTDALDEQIRASKKKKVEVALQPLRAKEQAGVKLEEIKGAEEANKQLAQLAREKAETAIKAEHEEQVAKLNLIEDATKKRRALDTEEIHFAEKKKDAIDKINIAEATTSIKLAQAKVPLQIQQTYTTIPDKDKQEAEIAKFQTTADNFTKKTFKDVELGLAKTRAEITAATSKKIVSESQITAGQTKTQRDIDAGKITSDADIKAIGYQTEKIELQNKYDAQLGHTHEQQIANLKAEADAERKAREAHIAGLKERRAAHPEITDDKATSERAKLTEEIAKAEAENVKANAESAGKLVKAGTDYERSMLNSAKILSESATSVAVEKVGQQKLKLQEDYATQLSHTHAQEIQYHTELAAKDIAQRDLKIQGLRDIRSKVPEGEEYNTERLNLDKEIADAEEQRKTALQQAEDQITKDLREQNTLLDAQTELAETLTKWRQIGLGDVAKDFADALIKVPQGIGEAIAAGLFDREKGKGIGQVMAKEILDSLKQGAKSLAGSLATQGIEKLISVILHQNIFQSAQILAINKNTEAIAALTLQINNLIVAMGGTVPGTSAGTPPTGTGGATPSSPIEAVGATLKRIWDKIFGGSSGLPAATNLLGVPNVPHLGPTSNAGPSLGSTLGGDACCQQSKNILQQMNTWIQKQLTATLIGQTQTLAHLSSMESVQKTTRDAAINSAITLDAILGIEVTHLIISAITGHAAGGVPALGAISLVGEKGPELFVPRELGTIIPHGQTKEILSQTNSNQSASSGDLKSGGTEIHLHGANFYGVSNTREMMRQIANYSKTQGIRNNSVP